MWPIAADVTLPMHLSVGHNHEPHKNGRTDRCAVWDMDSGGPVEPYVMWGPRSHLGTGQFLGSTAVTC